MAHENYIYDLAVEDNALVARDQDGEIRKQLQKTIFLYEYEENPNLNAPAAIKLIDGLNNDLYLDVNRVANISGSPFVGDFDALKTAVVALIDEVNAEAGTGGEVQTIEGFGFLGQGLPSGVWNLVTLDASVANKTVFVHAECNTVLGTARLVGVRPIGGTGVIAQSVAGTTTTGWLVQTNESSQIELFNSGAGVAFYHMSTLTTQ